MKKRARDIPGTGVNRGYEPPHGCWKLTVGPLKKGLCALPPAPTVTFKVLI